MDDPVTPLDRLARQRPTGETQTPDGRRRAVIENVKPQVDGGLFAIKRCLGESVTVEADIFTDGHDAVRCRLLYLGRHTRRLQGAPGRAEGVM